MTLLQRTIKNVLETEINDIVIVTGYWGEKIRKFIKQNFPDLRVRYVLNPNYVTTNNAYSLFLTKIFFEDRTEKINSGILLLDSDVSFSSKLLPFLILNNAPDKIAVRVSGNHNEEEMRVEVDDNGLISKIGKEIPLYLSYGESIGIEIFSSETTRHLFSTLERRIRNDVGQTEFYEASFQEMVDSEIKLRAVDVSQFPSIEIDTLEDLKFAERLNFD